MRQSQLFCFPKRTASKDADNISYQYLTRADFIEQSSSGVYRFLPLGFKVLRKIEDVIRKEMLELGAQEVYLPTLQNKSLWLETGRWTTIDPPLFKLQDRHQKEIALGSTHEEEMTDIFRHRVKSYKNLPLALFQIQNKFRNEMRPTGGLLRTLEFMMKDLYSFHADEKDLMKFYEKAKKAYFNIFKKCGLKPFCVEADSGSIGGNISNEFMVISSVGEDKVLICEKCGFGGNIEKTGEITNCPNCKSSLKKENCIEVGHIFNLGTKYSKIMKAEYLDKQGSLQPAIMGCYGIGIPRLMAVVVETNHDDRGIIWPKSIAPFQAHLISIDNTSKESEKLYEEFQSAGIDVLYDDRDNTPGEKFAEADLIGSPIRIVVSKKTLASKSVEIKRRDKEKIELVKLSNLETKFRGFLET